MDRLEAKGRPDQLEALQEAGWTWVSRDAGWDYFCRPAAMGDDQQGFHSDEERLAICRRIVWGQLLAMVPLYILAPVAYLTGWLDGALKGQYAWIGILLVALFLVLVIGGLAMNVTVLMKLNGMKHELTKQGETEQEPAADKAQDETQHEEEQ